MSVVVRHGELAGPLFDRLHRALVPLFHAGWLRIDEDCESSSVYGDSVSYMLERDGTSRQLEM